ncbi:hypothetical protein FMM05_10480 [Flavobacterium zepuense]|uniref:Uncharacterized protein n=1 Tax=Flavobacterium zepuense TaxID=2593302 RepID=A0A552V1D6_9FLAO|nr:hypothetical protein [Flavobacterium zepuense]TRW24252.1 hypothetical protein FMM05_10480 [Flavobacterium zepuense]
MEFSEIIDNEYFDKIILSLIPIILKLFVGKDSNPKKYWQIVINYFIPVTTLLWINLDENIEINKLTSTLIGLNFTIIVFNYWQQKLNDQNDLLIKFTNIETDKIQQINNINNVQVEKITAINSNQKYILDELSRINDRIMNHLINK